MQRVDWNHFSIPWLCIECISNNITPPPLTHSHTQHTEEMVDKKEA